MAIPDYETIMLPLLKYAGDGKEHTIYDAIEYISNLFELSDVERRELLPSGQQYVITNRVGWARTYLKKAGLLESPKRAYFIITQRGLDVLKNNPSEINSNYLKQFPEFLEFQSRRKEKEIPEENQKEASEPRTPQELIEQGYQSLYTELS